MDVLFDIPVIGLLFQLVAYLVVLALDRAVILALARPIALGALCGFMSERTGVVNIGIEGMMLLSAFVGWIAAAPIPSQRASTTASSVPRPPCSSARCWRPWRRRRLAVHAFLSISVRADQIISGTIINIFRSASPATSTSLITSNSPAVRRVVPALVPPAGTHRLPVVGWFFNTFLNQGPIAHRGSSSSIVPDPALPVPLGAAHAAVGEHPRAAETVGIDVIRMRYRNVILGGVFAGLAARS